MNADAGLVPLRRALAARLVPRAWERFGVLVDNLETAWSAADSGEFDNAVLRLDLAVRKRASRLGEEPVVPMTPPVRERVNRMIHVLTEVSGRDTSAVGGRDAVGPGNRRRPGSSETPAPADTGH
ncbi:CATRA system-associated protein [Frankia sp. EAN1pec]|uniref:CATRA system-associated protein n=1 Tax=Parafrankia sp. (strain EAN1pec) TaxID=298653 RepID=UPI0012FC20A8